MKTLLTPILAGLALACAQPTANAQSFSDHVSKEFILQKPAASSLLAIYNVFGAIKVEGYSGDKVVLDINETISADNEQDLATGKKEFKLAFDQKDDTITCYIAEPRDSRPRRHWNDTWDDRRIEYKYNLDFSVKVPFGMNLIASTVNEGNVSVTDVAGNLRVHNVNGSITVTNAKGTSDIRTVNGDVTVNYLSTPPDNSSYYTVNGEMNITYPANLSADLEFKSMNGAFYTSFPEIQVLPVRVTKNQETHGGGTVYRISKNRDIRIGAGGRVYKFETLNGNIYIKKQA
jgi:hypothetical protein